MSRTAEGRFSEDATTIPHLWASVQGHGARIHMSLHLSEADRRNISERAFHTWARVVVKGEWGKTVILWDPTCADKMDCIDKRPQDKLYPKAMNMAQVQTGAEAQGER